MTFFQQFLNYKMMTILNKLPQRQYIKSDPGLSLDQNLDGLNLCLPMTAEHVIGKNI